MDSQYGEVYAELYRRHWWWRAREEFLLQLFAQLELPPRPSVLDIGCGDGLFFPKLRELGGTVAGLEADAALVSPTTLERESIHIGPFDESYAPPGRYSLVLLLDVLEHLAEPARALRQAAELLEPRGRLVVTVPAFRSLWTQHDELNHHVTRYTRATLREVADSAPLRIRQLRYFFHWLAPLKLVTRWKEQCLAFTPWSTTPAPPRVPQRLVNQVLLGISRWEQKWLTRLPMPFGSSLLMVCELDEAKARSSIEQ